MRADAIREVRITEQTYYRWRKQYGGMGTDQLKELKRLQKENERLRKAVSDLTLDKLIPACPLMRPRCTRNPKMATACAPIKRSDTYQRLPRTRKISLVNSSRFIHLSSTRSFTQSRRMTIVRTSLSLQECLQAEASSSCILSNQFYLHRSQVHFLSPSIAQCELSAALSEAL